MSAFSTWYLLSLCTAFSDFDLIRPASLFPLSFRQLVHESPRAAYLARAHFAATALDRLATRPFPRGVERRWLAYQAIRAVAAAHAAGVCHGACRTEKHCGCDFRLDYVGWRSNEHASSFAFTELDFGSVVAYLCNVRITDDFSVSWLSLFLYAYAAQAT